MRVAATLLTAISLATLASVAGAQASSPPTPATPAAPEPLPSPDVDLDQPPPPAPPGAPAVPPPPADDRWWETYEPRQGHGGKAPLVVVGSALAGIGTLTLFAAGVTWLVAYSDSRDLEDECVNNYCVQGTPGGDTYERVERLSKASQILVGVSFPLMAGGAALALIGGQLHGGQDGLEVSIHATPGGVVVGGRF